MYFIECRLALNSADLGKTQRVHELRYGGAWNKTLGCRIYDTVRELRYGAWITTSSELISYVSENISEGFPDFVTRAYLWLESLRFFSTCGLAETCRTHNLRVVSSSPGTANVVVDLSKPLYSALFRRPERYLVATWWEYHNLTAVWSAPSIWSLTWYGCILKRRDSDDFIGWRNNGQRLEAASRQ